MTTTEVYDVFGFVSCSAAPVSHNWERGVQTSITCGTEISLNN